MSLFVRKYQEGGNTALKETNNLNREDTNLGVQPVILKLGEYKVDANDFSKDLENNFKVFYNTYEGTWTNKLKQDIIKQHENFLKNLRAGNIMSINDDNTFTIKNVENSGMDFSEKGSWGRYSYFVKLIANNIKPKKETPVTPKKKFTTTSLLSDITNRYFPGLNPDYRSWYERDRIIENPDGTKVRENINRVNAILDLINEDYMSKYDAADEVFGDLEGAKSRVQALRKALADGVLNNKDYEAAAALGLNLRDLLSIDANISFTESGGFKESETTDNSSDNTAPKTQLEQLEETLNTARNGSQEDLENIAAKVNGWDANYSGINFKTNPTTEKFEQEILEMQRASIKNLPLLRKEKVDEWTANHYKTYMFPNFFKDLNKYLANPNATIQTTRGIKYKAGDFATKWLTFAIRNLALKKGNLLPDNIADELNQVYINDANTGFWTIPGSFNEDRGTILTFNPNTGEYKEMSLKTPRLKIKLARAGRESVPAFSPLEEYLSKNGLLSVKKEGGKFLQLGGFINQRFREENGQDVSYDYSSSDEAAKILGVRVEQPVATETKDPFAPSEEDLQKAKQIEYLQQQGLTGADIRELSSAGLDLASMGAAYIPGYGTLASLAAGLTSTGLHTYNLWTDKDGMTAGDWGETVGNVGLDLVGLIPYFGTGSKGSKILKSITKFAPVLIGAFGAFQLPSAANSLQKLLKEGFSSLTVEDYRNITNGIMAITGAASYHLINTPKAAAMKEKAGISSKKVGEIEVKVNGEKKTLTIDSEELPQFREKLKEAKNAEAANKVIRESPSIKKLVADVEQVSISKPSRKILGVGPDNTRGLNIRTKYQQGESALGNTIDEKIFKWALKKSELIENLRAPKNPLGADYWRNRYNVEEPSIKSTETPKAEPKESKVSEPKVDEKPLEVTTVDTEKPLEVTTIDTPKPTQTPKEKASSLLNEFASELNPQQQKYLKSVIKREPKALSKKLIDLEKSMKTLRENAKRTASTTSAANATEEVANSIKSHKHGSKLQKIISFQNGGNPTGVKRKRENWYNDIFSVYKNHILESLDKEGNDYGDWINNMQDRHYTIYTRANNWANNKNTTWEKLAYKDPLVGKYQRKYKGLDNDKSLNDNNNVLYTGDPFDFNIGIKHGLELGRYDISGPRRTSGDWGNENNYKTDNLYSSITDDRRILGRVGDWTNEQILDFNKELKAKNWEMYEDTKEGYYKLRRIPNDQLTAELQGNQSTGNQSNEEGTKVPGGTDALGNGSKEGTGDTPLGTRSNIDLYKYIPGTLALGRMIGDNESNISITKEYLGKLQAPLQQPWQFHRQVYGDYGSLKYAENQAAQIRSQMNRPFTSNATLATLRTLEGERLAADAQWKGKVADNQMLHETYEKSAAEQKANTQRATEVANTNRALLASLARDKASVWAAMRRKNHENLDNWLMGYVEKPIQEEAYRRKAYQDYYDYISLGPLEYNPETDPFVQLKYDELRSISPDDPEAESKRELILNEVSGHVKTESQNYKINQLAKFRKLYPYIVQRLPLDPIYNTNSNKIRGSVATPEYTVTTKPKYSRGGSAYPTAVIRAKSKDNDRLIRKIIDIIKANKDLAKGVKLTDYSKYIYRK